MLMNCERMQNSRLSYRKRNTRQSPTSLGIITRSMLRDGCELHKWSSTREISGRPRATKKSNDVFENVTSAPDVSDYDLYARERRLEATDRPFNELCDRFWKTLQNKSGTRKNWSKTLTFVFQQRWLLYEHTQYISVHFNGDRRRARGSVVEEEGERAKFLLVICFLNLFVGNFSNVIKKSVFTKWSLFSEFFLFCSDALESDQKQFFSDTFTSADVKSINL